MKKIFFVLSFLFLLTGCSTDDEPQPRLVYELVPIVSTNLPEQFERGKTYELLFTYSLPTPCHNYKAINVEPLEDGSTGVGVLAYYDANKTCEEQARTAETGFNFVAGQEEFYIFKFWQGQNEQGENQFLSVEIPVVSNSS
jgi:hypothetical protein